MLQIQIFIEQNNAGVWGRGKGIKMDTQTPTHNQLSLKNLSFSSFPKTFGQGLLRTSNRFWREVSPLHPLPLLTQSHHQGGNNLVRPITEFQTRKGKAIPSHWMKSSLRPGEAKWLAQVPTANSWLSWQWKPNSLILVQLSKGGSTWQHLKIARCPSESTALAVQWHILYRE